MSIGPQFGTVDPEWIRQAAREATRGLGFDLLLVCAFAFDPQAVRRRVRTEEFSTVQDAADGKVPICSSDELRPGDGRRAAEEDRSARTCSWCSASRTSTIEQHADEIVVEIRGVDVYNPTTGEIRS